VKDLHLAFFLQFPAFWREPLSSSVRNISLFFFFFSAARAPLSRKKSSLRMDARYFLFRPFPPRMPPSVADLPLVGCCSGQGYLPLCCSVFLQTRTGLAAAFFSTVCSRTFDVPPFLRPFLFLLSRLFAFSPVFSFLRRD